MANSFLNGLKSKTNYTLTENGAVTHKSTTSKLLDMFAMGAAYRTRSDADCILLFKQALEEDPVHALRCLFYIRDVRGGQGERRFFRVCMKWLANNELDMVIRNMKLIPEYGRWDDLYTFVGTPAEETAFEVIKDQLAIDLTSLKKSEQEGISLLGKWLKSCNASSKETIRLGNITRTHLGLTQKQYRKVLSALRSRINIVEKLMSENRWDEIEFDKIPSKAGFIYRNAFARRDMIKARYEAFAKDTNTKVNAKTLYPYEVVREAHTGARNETDRAMVNKYWDNLADYFNNAEFNGIAVVDTSGSMDWSYGTTVQPIDVAISLGLYCAEKAKGPFAGHYISFASRPQLIETDGIDFVDKVRRIYRTNLCDNTNIEATFDLILETAFLNNLSQDELPQNIIIISDMEFDAARRPGWRSGSWKYFDQETLMENIANKWASYGYKMPHLIFWNVNARQNNIPMLGNGPISFVSGFSPSIFEVIMSGKTGYDLMLEKLDSERYASIN